MDKWINMYNDMPRSKNFNMESAIVSHSLLKNRHYNERALVVDVHFQKSV